MGETIHVYGRSDDIINAEGDVNEQYYADYGEPTVLYVDGTRLRIEYDGSWLITPIDTADHHEIEVHPLDSDASVEYCDYSEVATITSQREFKFITTEHNVDERELELRKLVEQMRDDANSRAVQDTVPDDIRKWADELEALIDDE